MTRPPCRNCGNPTRPGHTRHGLCPTCYSRWTKAGRPATVPPPRRDYPRTPAQLAGLATARNRHQAAAHDRYADYARLRSKGRPLAACAAWLGISERTAYRYEARLNAPTTQKGTAA